MKTDEQRKVFKRRLWLVEQELLPNIIPAVVVWP